jgi:hypothetical protein
MNWLDLVQMVSDGGGVLSARMMASQRTWKRNEGFWLFLLRYILWVFMIEPLLRFFCSSVWPV